MKPVSSHSLAVLRLARAVARALLWLLLAAGCVSALIWGILYGFILPRIDQWKPDIEQAATQALGISVQVGTVSAKSGSWLPTLTLTDVFLQDDQGHDALHLQRIQGHLSLRSLWQGGFSKLLIEQPTLDIRRHANGQIRVAGLLLGLDGDGHASADWVLSQPEIGIQQGVLRWTDEQHPEQPQLTLQHVDIQLHNHGRQHDWQLEATPPPAWGKTFRLQAKLQRPWFVSNKTEESNNWQGTVAGEFAAIQLAPWQNQWPTTQWPSGRALGGEVQLQFSTHLLAGRWQTLEAEIHSQGVALQFGARPPLQLAQLHAQLHAQQDTQGLTVTLEKLQFRTHTTTTHTTGPWRYQQHHNIDGMLTEQSLALQHIDLQTLQQLATQSPLDEETRTWLGALQPRGELESLHWQWQTHSAPKHAANWHVQAQLRQLGWQAVTTEGQQLPGADGLQLRLDATPQGGRAQLAMRRGSLALPGIFETPTLPIDQLAAQVNWQQQGTQWKIEIPALHFANADAAGHARGSWHTSPAPDDDPTARFPGSLNLDVQLSRANGTQVHRYLPLAIPAQVRHYVRDAVRHGRARNAAFRVRGDLRHFPFADPKTGEFNVQAALTEVDLDYVPSADAGGFKWPGLRQIDADFTIAANALTISHAHAHAEQLPQLQAEQVRVHIPSLTDDPHLQVQGLIHGPAADALAFVNQSPLRDLTAGALLHTQAQGKTEVQLQLDIPLQDLTATRVNGDVGLLGNTLQFSADTPVLQATHGTLHFTEQGFVIPQASAQVLGGLLTFSGHMDATTPPGLHFQGQGQATAAGLREAHRWSPLLGTFGQLTSGASAYQITLDFHGAQSSVQVRSDLQGLAIALPAPLGKPADTALPMRYQVEPGKNPTPATSTTLELQVGSAERPQLHARYERDVHGQVQRGAISIGTAIAPWPATGIPANLVFDGLSLDDWQTVVEQLQSPHTAAPLPALAGAVNIQHYAPTQLHVKARHIEHDGRLFHDLNLDMGKEQGRWRGQINARQLAGTVEYEAASAPNPAHIYARLQRLYLPPSAANEIEQLTQQAPIQLPTLDIVVEDLELGSRRLGRLDIQAMNHMAQPTQREMGSIWQLKTFKLSMPEAQLSGSGNWAIAANKGSTAMQRRTGLRLQLDIGDAGALLTRLGMPGVIRGGQGRLSGQIAWSGSPLALHPASLDGELELNLGQGQFLQTEPGLAKLLGVLSLQALPRRLQLDFRDIFSAGFAFDSITGQAHINNGLMSSDNLTMRGVNAAVLLNGQANLGQESQDIHVTVIPELNAGAASLVATMIHPITGLGSFLAQYLIDKPLQAATTQQFHISGSWYDPKVEKIEANGPQPFPPTAGERR